MFATALTGFPGSEQLAAFGVKCLAVAGGFLAGYVLGGIGTWALDKWVLGKKSPDVLKKTASIFTGIALALLIAFIVFGDGSGSGWLGGGGGTDGAGTNSQTTENGKKTDPATTPPDPKTPKIDAPKTPELHPDDPKVRVTFLGGNAVQGDRFYLIDDDAVPKSFAELKAIVQQRKEAAKGPLTLIVLYPSDPRQRIDRSTINVTQVTSWAEGLGIGVFKPGKK